MQNKRGISQAFSAQAATAQSGLQIRNATVFDVFEMSEVLTTSIIQLCDMDHGNDPAKLSAWLGNKTAADIRDWVIADTPPLICEYRGQVAGVGHALLDGSISLLYVAPHAVGHGLGQALLLALEAQLRAQGHTEAHLTATESALGFYQSHGWECVGTPCNCFGLPGQPMRKLLQPAG